ncbi:MAG: DNA cytosine methyltransferase [Patescibacteria group bacterium]|nr:DNA cytosine methyltransferase [Patescibacteria group bacterium]
MRLATLCSGVDGFALGMERAGMTCVYQCEIDRQCRDVLRRHWPTVPKGIDVNHERTADEIVRAKPDVIAFGSPCQDLSVAGRRAGLAGQRSGLFFRCVELCFISDARWVVWENVCGIFSSHGGKDFASVLEAFTGIRFAVPSCGWRNSGVAIGPLYSVAWTCLDSQYYGVAQRRKRVFLVASLGNRSGPYEVLSLADGVRWHPAPSREEETRVAAALTSGAGSGRGVRAAGRRREDDVNLVTAPLDCTPYSDRAAEESRLVLCFGGNNTSGPIDVAAACDAKGGTGRLDFESETFIVPIQEICGRRGKQRSRAGLGIGDDGDPMFCLQVEHQHGVAHTLRAEGFDASEDGTGRGTPLVPMATIKGSNETNGVPFVFQPRVGRNGRRQPSDVSPALTGSEAGETCDSRPCVVTQLAVRRLMPIETERLMGWDDNHTAWGVDENGNRVEMSDSARYRMCGNGVVASVAEWIGKRILENDECSR